MPTMLRRSLSPLLSTLLLLGLGSEVLAQGDRDIQWPSGLGTPGTFGRTVAGDMSGDGVNDVVVLAGTQPVYLFDPQLHDLVVEIPVGIEVGPVTDIDMIPGTPSEPAVLVCAIGASLYTVTIETPLLDPEFVSSLAFTGTWTAIDLVRAADLDDDGHCDFVGIADGDILFQAIADGAGAYTAGTSFQVNGPVREIEVVSWNANDLAIALHSDVGVKVYDQQGIGLSAYSSVPPGNAMGVIHTTRMFDRLAWQKFETEEVMYTLASDPLLLEGPLDFDFSGLQDPPQAISDVVAVVGCDHDGDKLDDVVVVHQGAHQAVVFPNETPASPAIGVTPSAAVSFGPTGAAPNQFAHPVGADLNHDGRQDLLIPVQDTEAFALRFGPFLGLGQPPAVPPPAGSGPFGVYDTQACCDELPLGDIALHLFDVRFDNPKPAVTHANVILWRRPGPTQYLQSMAIANLLFPVDGPITDPLVFDDLTVVVSETCSIPENPFDALYYMEFRLVKAPGGSIQKVLSRTYTGCWGSDVHLEEAGHFDPMSPGLYQEVNCLEETVGSIKLGGFVPDIDLPNFAPGAIPLVPQPTEP